MESEGMNFTSELSGSSPQNLDPQEQVHHLASGRCCPEPKIQGHTWVGLGKEVEEMWVQHLCSKDWGLQYGSSPRG